MKRFSVSLAVCFSFLLFACNNGGDSPESIAKKWCDLNSKVHKASTPEAKEAAEQKRDDYEKSMQAKYGNDEEMRKKIDAEVEKCEAASEGRE